MAAPRLGVVAKLSFVRSCSFKVGAPSDCSTKFWHLCWSEMLLAVLEMGSSVVCSIKRHTSWSSGKV